MKMQKLQILFAFAILMISSIAQATSNNHPDGVKKITLAAETAANKALSGNVQILAWIPYTDINTEYPNTLAAISTYFTNYTVTESSALDAATLADELVGKDVFLVPEPAMTDSATLTSLGGEFSTVLDDFANNGGTVIVCAEWNGYSGFLKASGLMDVVFVREAVPPLPITNPIHPLAAGLGSSIAAANVTGAYLVYNEDADVLAADNDGFSVVASRNIGAGHVVLIGYDYYSYNDDSARIISNAVQWGISPVITRGWFAPVEAHQGDTLTFSAEVTGLPSEVRVYYAASIFLVRLYLEGSVWTGTFVLPPGVTAGKSYGEINIRAYNSIGVEVTRWPTLTIIP